jgi:flagellar basal-body rod modification protein FlgD
MSVGGVGGNTNDTFSNLGLALQQSGDNKRTELGQDAFLKLMTAQMKNQDPFKPMESGEFLGQIAQFSTVSGIQQMQASLAGLNTALTSNQSLQAANLVGHAAMIDDDSAYLFAEGGLSGSAALDASGAVAVDIVDSTGQVVRRLDLGTQPAGDVSFTWDGNDESGARLPEGRYTVRATALTGGATSALDTQVMGVVSSVTLGSSGLSLNLYGMDPVALSAVREII